MVEEEARSDHEPMPQGFSIAIDGPVASGKGTLAKALARKFSGFYLDTGSMYRAVAVAALDRGLNLENPSDVQGVLPDVNIGFEDGRVLLNGVDVTHRIRENDASHGSSIVAVYGPVREDLVLKQRELARRAMEEGQVVILDGRDTGTRVLPNATFKLFLTARPEVRAKRRRDQLLEKPENEGKVGEVEEILADLRRRDERDMTRAIDPLPNRPEERGYWVLDNSDQEEDQTIRAVLEELRKRKLIDD